LKFLGTFSLPGDKSIAHRALIVCSWYKGNHSIKNFPKNEDVLTTLEALKLNGLKYVFDNNSIHIDSTKFDFKESEINCNSSGTSARLLCGYLAGASIKTKIFGSDSLTMRPMDRICNPLNEFGAKIKSSNGFLPIHINYSSNRKSFKYDLKIPSAQIKASLIFYAMFMNGRSSITGSIYTRDHLEKLLRYVNYPIKQKESAIHIKGCDRISKNLNLELCGDISSASFMIAGAVLLKDSAIKIKKVCFNNYRLGFFDKLIAMGANISFSNERYICGERVADIEAKYSPNLKGIKITLNDVPSIIDEIPILSIVALYTKGITVIEGVNELKIKESNRVEAIIHNAIKMGGSIKYKDNSLQINPKNKLYNATIDTFNDHRIFMTFFIANLVAGNKLNFNLKDNSYKKSFIEFFDILKEISK